MRSLHERKRAIIVIFLPGGPLRQLPNDWTVEGTDSQTRCDRAAKEYRHYKNRGEEVKILTIGGITRPHMPLAEATYYARYLEKCHHIPPIDLIEVGVSNISTENVAYSFRECPQIMQEGKIVIVSQFLHAIRLNISFFYGFHTSVERRAAIISWWPRNINFWYEPFGIILTLFDPLGNGWIFRQISRQRSQP